MREGAEREGKGIPNSPNQTPKVKVTRMNIDSDSFKDKDQSQEQQLG